MSDTDFISFEGFSNRRLVELFFALLPDMEAAPQIAQTAWHFHGKHRLSGQPFAASRFHLPLHGVGMYNGLPQGVVTAAREAAARVAASPFEIEFDRVMSTGGGGAGNKALVLSGGDAPALVAFRRDLGAAMTRAGLGRYVKSSFTPSMTLFYDTGSVPPETISPIRWTVREFVLIHCPVGETKHTYVGRWQLAT